MTESKTSKVARRNGCSLRLLIEEEETEFETIAGHLWFASRENCEFVLKLEVPEPTMAYKLFLEDKCVDYSLINDYKATMDALKDENGVYRRMTFIPGLLKKDMKIGDPKNFGISTLRVEVYRCEVLRFSESPSAAAGNLLVKDKFRKNCVVLGDKVDRSGYGSVDVALGRVIASISLFYGPRGLLDDKQLEDEKRERERQNEMQDDVHSVGSKRPAETQHEEAPPAKRPRPNEPSNAPARPGEAAPAVSTVPVRVFLMTAGDSVKLDVDREMSLVELRCELERTVSNRMPLRYVFYSSKTEKITELKDEKLTLVRTVAPELFLRSVPKVERTGPIEVISLDDD